MSLRIYGSQNECYSRNGVVSEYYSKSDWLTAECESTGYTDDEYNYDDNGYTWDYQIVKCQGYMGIVCWCFFNQSACFDQHSFYLEPI